MSALKALQDSLGYLNDLEVADRIISTLLTTNTDNSKRSQVEAACNLVRKLHSDAAAQAEPETAALWRKFKKLPPF